MTPRTRIRRRRSSSRHGKTQPVSCRGSCDPGHDLPACDYPGRRPADLGCGAIVDRIALAACRCAPATGPGVEADGEAIRRGAPRNGRDRLIRGAFVCYAIVRWLTSPAEYFSRIEAMDVVALCRSFPRLPVWHAEPKILHGAPLFAGWPGVAETAMGFIWSIISIGHRLALRNSWGPIMRRAGWVLTVRRTTMPPFWSWRLERPWPSEASPSSRGRCASFCFYVAITMIVGVLYSGSRGGWDRIPRCPLRAGDHGHSKWNDAVVGSRHRSDGTPCHHGDCSIPSRRFAQDRLTDPSSPIYGGRLDTNIRIELARDGCPDRA